MTNIRTIIWDLDETVWFYNDNETKVLCEKLNIDDLETFTEQYYEMWGSLSQHFTDKIVTYERIKEFISEKMPILKSYAISEEDLLKVIRDEKRSFITLNHEAVEMMKYFYEKGLKNISITDWITEHQEHALESLKLRSYIEEIYGCDNRYLKNSSKKVAEVTRELIMDKPDEYIMIGDSLSSDIFFANELGIRSIWYNRKGKKNETGNNPTIEVKSLLELKQIL